MRVRRPWRRVVAWATLAALAWPSLGPLPYLVHAPHAHHAVSGSHELGLAERPAERHAGQHAGHVDLASIPGSPAHPADHRCAECEVLKHLSRCVLPVFGIAVVAPVVVAFVTVRIVAARPRPPLFARLPPVRAPPIPTLLLTTD